MKRMTPKELVAKYGWEGALYTILTSTLGNAKMATEKADQYIVDAIKRTTIINEARRLPMGSPQRDIDRITHTGRVIEFPDPGEGAAAADAGAVGFATRSLNVVRLIAAESFSKETLEDNLEGDDFEDTLISTMAALFGRDWEELALYGDNAGTALWISGDATFYQLMAHDGWLQTATSTTDKDGAVPDSCQDLLEELLDAIPSEHLDSYPPNEWRFYASPKFTRKYRRELGERGTTAGDNALLTDAPLFYEGYPVRAVPQIKSQTRTTGAGSKEVTDLMLVHPRNLVVGVRRDVDVEVDSIPRQQEFDLVLTSRVDVEVENPAAYATIINSDYPAGL